MRDRCFTNTVADEASLQEKILILTPFCHVTIFLTLQNFAIFQIFRFFAKQIARDQNMVPDFSVYFHV